MTEQTTSSNPRRIFQIGSVRISEDASMAGKSTAEVQRLLTPLYPQVENATLRERSEADTTIVEFIAQPGRKG